MLHADDPVMTDHPGNAPHGAGCQGLSRCLRLAIPWFTRATVLNVRDLRLAAAEWLVARGRSIPAPRTGWRPWLLDDAGQGDGILERFPAGPCVRAARTNEMPAGTWACATPVHLLAAIEHLRIAPPGVVELDPEEAEAIGATLQEHFSAVDHAFVGDLHGGWLWSSAREVQCTSVEPSAAAGSNLRDVMPAGRDGPEVCRLMNEVQMLLHEHPVNERRVARGQVTVNSLWLWGFGRVGEATTALPRLFSDDAWLQGLARLHGAPCSWPPSLAQALETAGGTVAMGWAHPARPEPTAQALEEVEFACFRPARDALASGRVDQVDLLLGGHALRVVRGDRWRIWRRRRPLAELLP